MLTIDYSLYLVTDHTYFNEETFYAAIETALQNGVTIMQLREKDADSRRFFERALKVKRLTDFYQVPLIINDRIDIALAVDAAGVHLGQSDLPAKEARKLLGKDKLIGVSAKTISQALDAQEAGANYLGTGAINPTTTKVITQLTEISTLKAICNAVNIPVVAIGGISENNASNLKNTNINGIAVVSAILAQPDIASATKKMSQISKSIIG
ncbi:thiamine phosphate synthase [Cellulosilyticum sp. I15G10I2]|uniref:thiamine phosphate synthase n=1 Tax=Cellulosilyticum sp. I15G10I2 TaxID=1892843 RepID=UPI000AF064BA|nr:thiamine phosphate synthase [Cellulosilyticum sp. I15G10I2]